MEGRPLKAWSLSHSQEGHSVSLREVPFWAWAAARLGDNACWLLEQATGFCFIAPPDWMYKVRWGKPDAEGFTSRSLGSACWTFGQALCDGFGTHRREKQVSYLPVSYEWMREHCPDALRDDLELEEDE